MTRHRTLSLAIPAMLVATLVVSSDVAAYAQRLPAAPAQATAPTLVGQPSVGQEPLRPPRKRPRSFFPPGPASPTSPTIDRYYYFAQHGSCGVVRDLTAGKTSADGSEELFAALADVCLGTKSRSHVVDWAGAATALAASAALDDCLSVSARAALGRAVGKNATYPSSRPSFGKAPAGAACQPVPTMALLVRGPDGGPTSLVLLGLRLFEARKATIDGTWFPAVSYNAVEGTDCARVDVSGTDDLAEGSRIVVQVKGNGFTTTPTQWPLGTAVDTATLENNLDTDRCVFTPPDAASP